MQGVLLETTSAEPTGQWAAIILGILTLIYLIFVRPMRKGKKKDPLARTPVDRNLSQHRAVERDMTALLVEYEQMMRKMTTQLETRVLKLEMLLQEADQKIATLSAAPSIPLSSNIDSSRDDSGIGFGASAFPQAFVLRPENVEPQHVDVYALADAGMSYRQIAQKLDRAYGEIELILKLRGNKAPPGKVDASTPGEEMIAAGTGTEARSRKQRKRSS